MGIGIGEVFDVKTQVLIGRMHRQRLIVDVAGNAGFGHFNDDLVALLGRNTRDLCQIQMARGLMFVGIMLQHLYTQGFQDSIVFADDLLSAAKHFGITLQLLQANGSGNGY